jgi:hypothetical protein
MPKVDKDVGKDKDLAAAPTPHAGARLDMDDDEDEASAEDEPVRCKCAAGAPTGTVHVTVAGKIRPVHVKDGVTELVPRSVAKALGALGYLPCGG